MKAIEATSMQLQIGADTPSRDYQIKMNLSLWETCEVISKTFIPPSGAEEPDLYRDRDKLVFATKIQQVLLDHTDQVFWST